MTRYNVGDLIEYTRTDGETRNIGSILRVERISSYGFFYHDDYSSKWESKIEK